MRLNKIETVNGFVVAKETSLIASPEEAKREVLSKIESVIGEEIPWAFFDRLNEFRTDYVVYVVWNSEYIVETETGIGFYTDEGDFVNSEKHTYVWTINE